MLRKLRIIALVAEVDPRSRRVRIAAAWRRRRPRLIPQNTAMPAKPGSAEGRWPSLALRLLFGALAVDAAQAAILALAALLFTCADSLADLRPSRPRGDPPMRIVRVMSSDPACQPNCAEWISAEGRIMPGTGAAFAKAIANLRGRRLPVLVSSGGGSLTDAAAMGQLIRQKRLAVAVARTLIERCPARAGACPDPKGQAITGGAKCASACPFILAGGVERFVGPAAMVGVHQITAMTKEPAGAAARTRVKKVYQPARADQAAENYLVAMGVGHPVMELMRKTPAARIRWLSLAEIRSSRLATLALDAPAPILTSGANGLNGHAFEGDSLRDAAITAHGDAPAASAGGESGDLETTISYRRGGGAVDLALVERDAPEKPQRPAVGWTLAIGPDTLSVKTDNAGHATIPVARFCAQARDGKIVAKAVSEDSATGFGSAGVDVAAMNGANALIDEACP
jgi:hypothetical protein